MRQPALEQETRKCLHQLQTSDRLPLESLHKIFDGNAAFCEELAAAAAPRRGRLKALLDTAAREVGSAFAVDRHVNTDDIWGKQSLFNDFLGSLGWFTEASPAKGYSPASAPPSPMLRAPRRHTAASSAAFLQGPAKDAPTAPAMRRTVDGSVTERSDSATMAPHAAAPLGLGAVGPPLNLDTVLGEMLQAPARAAHQGVGLLQELDDLHRRFNKLRTSWPGLKTSVWRAYQSDVPVFVSSLRWTLKEALSWQRQMEAALARCDASCALIEDCIEQHRLEVDANTRFRAKASHLLGGLEKPVGARAEAVLWLRRSAAAGGQVDDASPVVEKNIEVANAAQHRLMKCASAVIRLERNHILVHQAVSRLSQLRGDLQKACDLASKASHSLSALPEEADCTAAAEAVSATLKALLAVIDKAGQVTGGFPLEVTGLDEPDSTAASEALSSWLATSPLLRDEGGSVGAAMG